MTSFEENIPTIRKLREGDLDEILFLQNEAFLSPWSKCDYEKEISRNDSVNVVALYNKEIVGFIVMRVTDGVEAEIYNIAVRKKYRNKGIGKKMLAKAMQLASLKTNITEVWLEVRQSNQVAINFYESYGFTITGCRKNFYNNTIEDALLMKIDLKAENG